MLDVLERYAEVSVARGCGFAAIGIGTFMIGLAGDIPRAIEAGGLMTLATCLILFLKSQRARNRPYKRTELWIMLETAHRPEPAIAQQVIGGILRDMYLRYALYTAVVSAAMLMVSLALRIKGV